MDIIHLDADIERVPKLHSKYHGIWSDAQRKLIDYETDLASVERLLYEYYRRMRTDEEDLKVIDKTEPWEYESNFQEIRHLVATDPLVIELTRKVTVCKNLVREAEKIVDAILKRSYLYSALIEYNKINRGYM